MLHAQTVYAVYAYIVKSFIHFCVLEKKKIQTRFISRLSRTLRKKRLDMLHTQRGGVESSNREDGILKSKGVV